MDAIHTLWIYGVFLGELNKKLLKVDDNEIKTVKVGSAESAKYFHYES